MSGVNKVIILGRVGKDPDVKNFSSGSAAGTAIANFSIATSEQWTDKSTGEKKEKTEWHRIVAFGKLAEIIGKYITKGKQVYIEGSLQTRSWEKDGATHYVTEIKATTLEMLGGKSDSQPKSKAESSYKHAETQTGGSGIDEGEIPF